MKEDQEVVDLLRRIANAVEFLAQKQGYPVTTDLEVNQRKFREQMNDIARKGLRGL